MFRNDFIIAFLIVVALLLLGILTVTGVFVWRSGLFSNQPPIEESLTGMDPLAPMSTPQPVQTDPASLPNAPGSFSARVFCVDPTTEQLVYEDRSIAGAPHMMGKILKVLEALRATPTSPQLQPAVPPEIQFRSAFYDRDAKTIYIDIAKLPESWNHTDPITVGLCLYSVVHTVTNLGSDFQYVRFLVDGKEPESSPGGVVLSEPFSASEEWLGAQSTN